MVTEDMRAIEMLLRAPPKLPAWYGEFNSWDTWCDAVEQLLGKDIDGDEERDGTSLDSAYESWRANFSPAEYAAGKRPA